MFYLTECTEISHGSVCVKSVMFGPSHHLHAQSIYRQGALAILGGAGAEV